MTEHAVPVPETPKTSELPVVPPAGTRPPKVRTRPASSLLEPSILRRAAVEAFVKLDPRTMIRNPVMFVVEIGSVVTTVEFFARRACTRAPGPHSIPPGRRSPRSCSA